MKILVLALKHFLAADCPLANFSTSLPGNPHRSISVAWKQSAAWKI
jgi:hypothetical protein